MSKPLPRREDVPIEHTWDLESMYPSPEAWEEAFTRLERRDPTLGRAARSPGRVGQHLKAYFELFEQLGPEMHKLHNYAGRAFDVDTTNQTNAARVSRAQGLAARFMAAIAFAEPELLALDAQTLERFMAELPALKRYRHYLDNLMRLKPHVRSAEVEAVTGPGQRCALHAGQRLYRAGQCRSEVRRRAHEHQEARAGGAGQH
jgi:oligoendopeptidase F